MSPGQAVGIVVGGIVVALALVFTLVVVLVSSYHPDSIERPILTITSCKDKCVMLV